MIWGFSKEWRELRAAILERDDYTCAYCHRRLKGARVYAGEYRNRSRTKSALHVDHIVPRSKGGSDDPSNLVTACASCNMRKYDKVLPSASAVLANGGEIRPGECCDG